MCIGILIVPEWLLFCSAAPSLHQDTPRLEPVEKARKLLKRLKVAVFWVFFKKKNICDVMATCMCFKRVGYEMTRDYQQRLTWSDMIWWICIG